MKQITMQQARQDARLSVEEIAEAIGVSVPTYKKYEKSNKNMKPTKFYLFCLATGHSADDIIIN